MKRTFTKYPQGYVKSSSDISYDFTFTLQGTNKDIHPMNTSRGGAYRLGETKHANSVTEAARTANAMLKTYDYVDILIDGHPDAGDLMFSCEYYWPVHDIEDEIKNAIKELR